MNDLYYLVKESVYNEKFVRAPQLNEILEDLSPRIEKKVRKVLEFLLSAGIVYNKFGIVAVPISEIPTQFNVLEMVVYAVIGSGRKPMDFEQFVKYLVRVNAPESLFCKKVQKVILKNKHVKKKKREKVYQEAQEEGQNEISFERQNS